MWIPASLNLALLPLAAETLSPEVESLGGTAGPDLSRYFAVCAVLIITTAAVAWGMRRLVVGNLQKRTTKRSLQIIDVLSLGGKRKLAVVRCYDRTFALGLGEREVTAIAELDAAIAPEAPAPAGARSDQDAFSRALEQIRASLPKRSVKVRAPLPATTDLEPAPKRTLRQEAPATAQRVARQEAQPKTTTVVRRKKRQVVKASAQSDASADRKRDVQAVASAAREIAESKRRQSAGQERSVLTPKTTAAPKRSEAATPVAKSRPISSENSDPSGEERVPTLRLEGILG